MANKQKSPIAAKIDAIGEHSDEILESAQGAATKIVKRLLTFVGLAAALAVMAYQALVGFQEKTKDVFKGGGIEKVEDRPGSTVFRARGQSDPLRKDPPQSPPGT